MLACGLQQGSRCCTVTFSKFRKGARGVLTFYWVRPRAASPRKQRCKRGRAVCIYIVLACCAQASALMSTLVFWAEHQKSRAPTRQTGLRSRTVFLRQAICGDFYVKARPARLTIHNFKLTVISSQECFTPATSISNHINI